ncbi:hypothetical protein JL720_4713 [Aureococcus anophagefferens]|nr:hypothetical protein JL720_4713 [Aureococcus anophagefferens]
MDAGAPAARRAWRLSEEELAALLAVGRVEDARRATDAELRASGLDASLLRKVFAGRRREALATWLREARGVEGADAARVLEVAGRVEDVRPTDDSGFRRGFESLERKLTEKVRVDGDAVVAAVALKSGLVPDPGAARVESDAGVADSDLVSVSGALFRVAFDDAVARSALLRRCDPAEATVEFAVEHRGRPVLAWRVLRDLRPGDELLVGDDDGDALPWFAAWAARAAPDIAHARDVGAAARYLRDAQRAQRRRGGGAVDADNIDGGVPPALRRRVVAHYRANGCGLACALCAPARLERLGQVYAAPRPSAAGGGALADHAGRCPRRAAAAPPDPRTRLGALLGVDASGDGGAGTSRRSRGCRRSARALRLPGCDEACDLLRHFDACRAETCRVCAPARRRRDEANDGARAAAARGARARRRRPASSASSMARSAASPPPRVGGRSPRRPLRRRRRRRPRRRPRRCSRPRRAPPLRRLRLRRRGSGGRGGSGSGGSGGSGSGSGGRGSGSVGRGASGSGGAGLRPGGREPFP